MRWGGFRACTPVVQRSGNRRLAVVSKAMHRLGRAGQGGAIAHARGKE
jgi:hypothetical protein